MNNFNANNMLIVYQPQAYELSVLTGTQVLLLVVSETGLVYTFTTPKLQPLVTKPEGKNLIQVSPLFFGITIKPLKISKACLNAPEPAGNENGVDPGDVPDSPEDVSSMPPQQSGMPRGAPQHAGYMTQEQQQQAIYYQSLQQNQGGQYAGMPQMPAHQRGTV